MKVGFTGSRRGMTPKQKKTVAHLLQVDFPCNELHHGDCIGADFDAATIAAGLGIWVVSHPPDKDRLRAFHSSDHVRVSKPYLVRNMDIVDETEVLIATTRSAPRRRSGTWHTIRYARKQSKLVMVVGPCGVVVDD